MADTFQALTERLRNRLMQPLPGLEAQIRMTSIRNARLDPHFEVPKDARPSSVLILYYPLDNEPTVVFIRRPLYEGIHSGQISFPGGQAEPSDSSAADTALRESWEETGIRPDSVTLQGSITPLYIPPSRFLVTPFVGYSLSRPNFVRDPQEVDAILEIPLAKFYDPRNIREVDILIREGYSVHAPAYVIDEEVIWGATAMMFSEFLELARKD